MINKIVRFYESNKSVPSIFGLAAFIGSMFFGTYTGASQIINGVFPNGFNLILVGIIIWVVLFLFGILTNHIMKLGRNN